MQNDFSKGGSLEVPDSEAILPVIEKIRTDEIYMDLYEYVYFTRDWHPQNHISF